MFYKCLISRKKYFSLWNARLIVFLPENPYRHRVMARNQSLCQVSSTCTDFERQQTNTRQQTRQTNTVQLWCFFVTELAPNSIKTKYLRGLSLLVQEWRWRLKQSFNPTHLKQAKWSPNSHFYLLRWAYLPLRSTAEHCSYVVHLPG